MRYALLAAALLTAGCVGPARQAETASFDLGPAAAAPGGAGELAAVSVSAPSWLDSPAMQYRLLYAEPARRLAYAESRWAAPPAELLGRFLGRRLAAGQGGRCRLRLELDEFLQVFAAADASRLALEGRAELSIGGEVLARRAFALSPPAPTPDARGGVAAAAAAAEALSGQIAGWLSSYQDRCRS